MPCLVLHACSWLEVQVLYQGFHTLAQVQMDLACASAVTVAEGMDGVRIAVSSAETLSNTLDATGGYGLGTVWEAGAAGGWRGEGGVGRAKPVMTCPCQPIKARCSAAAANLAAQAVQCGRCLSAVQSALVCCILPMFALPVTSLQAPVNEARLLYVQWCREWIGF